MNKGKVSIDEEGRELKSYHFDGCAAAPNDAFLVHLKNDTTPDVTIVFEGADIIDRVYETVRYLKDAKKA